ncbi:MAG: pyridoxamine 5'-phosphate oxidase family protein [Acidimicrobiales bacterium]
MTSFLDIAFTPCVLEVQDRKGSLGVYPSDESAVVTPHQLDKEETLMIESADSFYMATVGETGWPYVQHRGGDPGFVKAIGPTQIGWVERSGNRQYLGAGNVSTCGRVALIFMDYPNRVRLKLYGNATYHAEAPEALVHQVGAEELRADGAFTIDVVATAWNCPKYITPRFTEQQVNTLVSPLVERIAELESQVQHLTAAQTQ